MRITKWVLTLMVILASHVRAQDTPLADHHQHLFSPDMAAMLAQTAPDFKTINARDLIALLDSAGDPARFAALYCIHLRQSVAQLR